jgi:hypothetical protein
MYPLMLNLATSLSPGQFPYGVFDAVNIWADAGHGTHFDAYGLRGARRLQHSARSRRQIG